MQDVRFDKASTMKVGAASTGDTMFMTKKALKYCWFGAPLLSVALQVTVQE
jgi:hypothetical protein